MKSNTVFMFTLQSHNSQELLDGDYKRDSNWSVCVLGWVNNQQAIFEYIPVDSVQYASISITTDAVQPLIR